MSTEPKAPTAFDRVGEAVMTPDLTERARAEARRRYPDGPRDTARLLTLNSERMSAFIAGAAWAAQQSVAAERVSAQPGDWWRVDAPDGSLWCETSNETEARESMRPGDVLWREWVTPGSSVWLEVTR